MRERVIIFIIFVGLTLTFSVSASESEKNGKKMSFNGYSGGMMLHAGYGQSRNFTIYDEDDVLFNGKFQGAVYGIGGAMRVMFGNHLRVGMEGYASNSKYSKFGGYTSLGWGGLLLDSKWDVKKWTIFVGGAVGGGGYKFVFIPDYNKVDNNLKDFVIDDNVSYRSYPFVALVPFVGVEYAMTQRVHVVAKIDYLFSVSKNTNDFVTGPRLFLGFMFYHHTK